MGTHTQVVDELPVSFIPPARVYVLRFHVPPGLSAGLGGSACLARVANESWSLFIVQIQNVFNGT